MNKSSGIENVGTFIFLPSKQRDIGHGDAHDDGGFYDDELFEEENESDDLDDCENSESHDDVEESFDKPTQYDMPSDDVDKLETPTTKTMSDRDTTKVEDLAVESVEPVNLSVTYSSNFAVLNDRATEESIQTIFKTWGIENRRLVFVFACDTLDDKKERDLLMKAACKANEANVNMAYVFVPCDLYDWHFDCNRCESVPCIGLLTQQDDLSRLSGVTEIAVTDIDGSTCSFNLMNDTDFDSSFLHPSFSQFIISNQNVEDMVLLLAKYSKESIALISGDTTWIFDKDCSRFIQSLPECEYFTKTLFLVRDDFEVNHDDTAEFVHVESMTPDALFLEIAHLLGSNLVRKNALNLCNSHSTTPMLKAGSLFSNVIPHLDCDGEWETDASYIKTYCVINKFDSHEQPLPDYILSDLSEYDKVVLFDIKRKQEAKNSKPEWKVDEHIYDIITWLKSIECEENTAGCLYVILDSEGILFSKKSNLKTFPWMTSNGDFSCTVICPYAKVKSRLKDWSLHDGEVERFPIKDWNGCVSNYVFVDDCDSILERNNFDSDFTSSFLDMLRLKGHPGTKVIQVTFNHANELKNSSVDILGMTDEDFVSLTIMPYNNECIPLTRAVIFLASTTSANVNFRCKPTIISSSIENLEVDQNDIDLYMRIALSLANSYSFDDKPSKRNQFSAIADVISSKPFHNSFNEMGDVCNKMGDVKDKRHVLLLKSLIEIMLDGSECLMRHPQVTNVVSTDVGQLDPPFAETDFTEIERLHPITELCLVCLIAGNLVGAEEMLAHTRPQEIAANALYAVAVIKNELKNPVKICKFATKEEQEIAMESANLFETHAKSIVHNTFAKNKDLSHDLLFKKHERYGNLCAFDLACIAETRSFLSDQACMEAISHSWWRQLVDKSWWKMILFFLIPWAICCCTNLEDDNSRMTLEDEERDKKKKSIYNLVPCLKIYKIPAVKCVFHYISFVTLLLVFSYMVLNTNFESSNITMIEYIILSWVVTLFVEELRQMKNLFDQNPSLTWRAMFDRYLGEFWNILDILCITLYLIGFGSRLASIFRPSDAVTLTCQVAFGMDVVMFYIRSLHFFAMHKKIGPLFIVVQYMFQDLANFFLIMLVVLAGYGVALHSILHPKSELSLSLLNNIIHIPYFQIYGELGVDTILEAQNGTYGPIPDADPVTRNYVGLVFAGCYLLFTNVLLLNLLIAMLNSSYAKVEQDTAFFDVIHKIEILQEYRSKSIFPPPLVVIDYLLVIPIRMCVQSIKKRSQKVEPNSINKNRFTYLDLYQYDLESIVRDYFSNMSDTEDQQLATILGDKLKVSEGQIKELLAASNEQSYAIKTMKDDISLISDRINEMMIIMTGEKTNLKQKSSVKTLQKNC